MSGSVSTRSPRWGGNGGDAFDGRHEPGAWGRITRLVIRHGTSVDAIGFGYANGKFVSYGGTGGTATTITLAPDEHIVAVAGRAGQSLDMIGFRSNRRPYGPFGTSTGGRPFEWHTDGVLYYVFGRAGNRIDQIGFGFGPTPAPQPVPAGLSRTAVHGGTGGTPFDDLHGAGGSGRIKTWGRITHLVVRHGNTVDGIGVGYASGKYVSHGGTGGNATTVVLRPDEWIAGVIGRAGALVDQLRFYTNKGAFHGPFGRSTGGDEFIHDFGPQALRYVFGRAGNRIDQIGFGFGDPPADAPDLVDPVRTAAFGGGGGDPFDDSNAIGAWGRVGAWGRIRQLVVRHGSSVDSIGVSYANGKFLRHGGDGGDATRITLAPDERICKVRGRAGASLDQIAFTTDRGTVYGPYGGTGGNPFDRDFGDQGLLYLFGRAGNRIDQLGFGYGDQPPVSPTGTVSRSAEYGGGGGDRFDDAHDVRAWGRVERIVVGHGNTVDLLGLDYANGARVRHGGSGGRRTEIELRPGEWIQRIRGRAGALLDSITFTSNLGIDYGPYGASGGGEPFDCELKGRALLYLFGRAGNRVDRIGFGYGEQPPELEIDAYAVHRGADDGYLWMSTSAQGRSWSESFKLGIGHAKSDPAHPPALAVLDGTLYLAYGDGADGALHWAGYDCDARSWSTPRAVPGAKVVGAPALAVAGAQLVCVHLDAESRLQWSAFDPRSRTWSAGTPHAAGPRAASGIGVATLDGVVHCLYESADAGHHVQWTTFDPATRTWGATTALGHVAAGAPALAVLDGRLYAVHRGHGADHHLYWSMLDAAAGTWSARALVAPDTETLASPSLAVVRGQLRCAYRSAVGAVLWSTTFDPVAGTWAPEQPFGAGNRSTAAPAVVSADDVTRPFVVASDRWMTAAAPILARRHLRELCIPGSHDAGAYELTVPYLDAYLHDSALLRNLKAAADAVGLGASTVDVIIESWSKAQRLDVADQLRAGIRFFDLRVMRYEGRFHVFHGFVGVELATILGAIRAFVRTPRRRELVLVDFSHFKNMRGEFSDADHDALVALIHDELGSYLVPAADVTTTPFGDLVAGGSRVVGFYDHPRGHRDGMMAARSRVYDGASNLGADGTSAVAALVEDAHFTVLNPIPGKLVKLGWSLTPDTDTLTESVTNRLNPLTPTHDLRWLDAACVEPFVEFARTHPEPIHLITADFVERSHVPDIAIARSTAAAGREVPPLTEPELRAAIETYGPVLQFHPSEPYQMCSVEAFLARARLHDGRTGEETGPLRVADLPTGAHNDGRYWLVLDDGFKAGDLGTARAYVRAYWKPGMTHTDLQFWFFYAYNGPGTAHVNGLVLDTIAHTGDASLAPLGEHYGDWECCMVRVDNTSKKMIGAWLSQHASGQMFEASQLDALERRGEQLVVYASRNGHAVYANAGANYTERHKVPPVGIPAGIELFLRNDTAVGGASLDCARAYELVSADWLAGAVTEPRWLDYPYRWGPSGSVTQMSPTTVSEVLTGALGWLAPMVEPLAMVAGIIISVFVKDDLDGPSGPKMKGTWNGFYSR